MVSEFTFQGPGSRAGWSLDNRFSMSLNNRLGIPMPSADAGLSPAWPVAVAADRLVSVLQVEGSRLRVELRV